MQTSVLLVEDNDDEAGLVARAVERHVHVELQLTRVASAADAKQELARRSFDALVLGGAFVGGAASFEEIRGVARGAATLLLVHGPREGLVAPAVELGAEPYVVDAEHRYEHLPFVIALVAERQRRHLEVAELTEALAGSIDAIATLNASGICVAVNPAFEMLLGHVPGKVPSTSLLEIVHEADRQHVTDALGSGAPRELEVRMIRRDGRLVPLLLSVIARPHGRGHFCFFRDVTRQRTFEGKLASAAAITAVGSLATGLAHEINNPLAVVLANVEEAVRVATDLEPTVGKPAQHEIGELRAMLEEALSASQRVQFIVRDLKPFACADERRVRIDLNAVVESCCNIAFAEIRHRARLVKDLNAVVPVVGSEAKLAQVVLNLLVNAAHAMPEGDVERNEIRITTRQQGRALVEIEVSDTGSGISPACVKQAFEPFFTTKPRRPGMGLAIAQATIGAHGGEITIRPREGGGTVVRVVLPTLETETADDSSPGSDGPPPPRVLVVDDDPLVLRSLTRVLARDFEVTGARNGLEALEMVRSSGGSFDAMLCDLMMPELSGIELHEALLRDDPELARRTVFLTGAVFSGRAQTFLEEVGLPHLEKPVDPTTVRTLLLDLSRTPRRARPAAKWLRRS